MSYGQKKDGRWYVKYNLNGKPKWEYFGRGLAAEKAAADRDLELKENGSINQYNKRQNQDTIDSPTFFELAMEYLKTKTSTDMAKSSGKGLAYSLNGTILPEIGHIEAVRITHARLDQYVQKRLTTPIKVWVGKKDNQKSRIVRKEDGTPRTVSRSTVHRELTDIQAILNWAVERKYILANPVIGHRKPKRDDSIIRPPSVGETRRILKHSAPHLIRALYLSYFTGLRPGAAELFGLKYDDVDWEANTIFILSAKKNGLPFRVVPLHPALKSKIRQWECLDEKRTDIQCRNIIHYKGRPIKRIKKAFAGAKRRAGIARRLRMYDFRHAAITMMLGSGADLKSVSEIAGHSRTDTTTKIYQHTDTELLRQQINLIPDLEDDDES